MKKSAEASAAAANKIARTFNRLEALHQPSNGDLCLHSGERHAGACMDACTKGEMPVGLSANVETVGVRELRRIAVGGANADMDVGAFRHRDAAQHRVLRCPAVSELVRAFDTQEFFDRGFDELRILAQLRYRIGISDQKIEAVANEVGGGLMSRIENENAIMQQFNVGQPFD